MAVLFAAKTNDRGSDADTIVRRFAGFGDDEFPEGVRLADRDHSPGTKRTAVIVAVDNVAALQLWLAQWIDTLDITLHPVTADETVAPVVEAIAGCLSLVCPHGAPDEMDSLFLPCRGRGAV